MKTNKYGLIILFIFTFFLCTCVDDVDLKLCGEGCVSTTPWRVESWDLNLPCFSTKDSCLVWAASHGYSDKPCIKCD